MTDLLEIKLAFMPISDDPERDQVNMDDDEEKDEDDEDDADEDEEGEDLGPQKGAGDDEEGGMEE